MKRILFILCILGSFFTQAQNQLKPVQSKFEIKKMGDNQYVIYANLTIEKGFHVFTPDPGGDGFLIPTTLTLEASELIKNPDRLTVESKVITKEIKEIGTVNFVEGKAVFSMLIKTSQMPTIVKGIFSYQCCNDQMCLPPVDENFTFTIKE